MDKGQEYKKKYFKNARKDGRLWDFMLCIYSFKEFIILKPGKKLNGRERNGRIYQESKEMAEEYKKK